MSQLGIFNNLDEETILAIQAKAVEMVLEGKTILNWSGEGTSVAKSFTMPIVDVLEEVKFSLQTKNPAEYGYRLWKSKPRFI